MIKALLKKQWIAALSVFTMGKDGKRRSSKTAIAFAILIAYAFCSIGVLYWGIAGMLCQPLVEAGLAWLYFAMMGVIATGMGVVLGIFTAKARLYEAKDNDLLLSMPIPSWVILFSRSVGLYAFIFLFEALVFIPAIARYFIFAGFALMPFLCCFVVMLLLPCLALALSYTLGWLLAVISAKIPGKNILETVFSILFLIGYFALYSKVNEYMGYVISHGEAVGRVMKTTLYPFSQLGKACTGNLLSLLLYVLIVAGVFLLIYLLMSASYLKLATTKKSGRKAKYVGKGYDSSCVVLSLMRKELRRVTKNSMVMLNCFIGPMMLVFLPFVVLFGGGELLEFAQSFQREFALILTAIVCVMSVSNIFTSCCISLEGDSLDVLRVLPVATKEIFLAKWLAGALTSGIPATFACVVLCVRFQQGAVISICVLLAVLACIGVWSAVGLIINLLLPNLQWTNEVAVVKQSASTMVSMLGGMGLVGLLVGGYFLFGKYLPAWGYLLICTALLAIVGVVAYFFLKKKGVKIFEALEAL